MPVASLSDRLFLQAHIAPGMASLVLFFLPVSLMLRQQVSRLIDEVEKLLRQVTLQHIQYPINALQQPIRKAAFFLQCLLQLLVFTP